VVGMQELSWTSTELFGVHSGLTDRKIDFHPTREDYITIWGVHQGKLGTTPETKKANRPHGGDWPSW